MGIINHTWSVGKTSNRPWVSVLGTLANLHFELGDSWLKIDYGNSQESRLFDADHWGILHMVLEFRRSIMEATEPAMTGEDGLNDLDIVLKAYQSAQTGLAVVL